MEEKPGNNFHSLFDCATKFNILFLSIIFLYLSKYPHVMCVCVGGWVVYPTNTCHSMLLRRPTPPDKNKKFNEWKKMYLKCNVRPKIK